MDTRRLKYSQQQSEISLRSTDNWPTKINVEQKPHRNPRMFTIFHFAKVHTKSFYVYVLLNRKS